MFTPSSVAPTLRVAIYRTSSIGDVVLATALLDLLTKLDMPTEAIWFGRKPSLDLIQQFWPEVHCVAIPRSAAFSELKHLAENIAKPHLFIDLQCNLRSRYFAKHISSFHKCRVFQVDKDQLRRGRLIIEARLRGRRRPLPVSTLQPPQLQYQMMAKALIEGLKVQLPIERLDGIDHIDYHPHLPVSDVIMPAWRKELRYGTWLAVAPGAAHPTKQAPLVLVEEVLRGIQKYIGVDGLNERTGQPGLKSLGLVFLGDSNDRQVARSILDHMHWTGPVLNLAGKLSLGETALALSECRGLLSNDSSLAHIAEAVDTSSCVLFGPTVEGFGFSPRMGQQGRSRAFSSLLGCRPCSKHGKVECRYGDKLCFAAIPAEAVIDYLLKILVS